MDHSDIFNELRKYQADPRFQENPTLGAILKQTVRMVKAEAQAKHIGNMLSALSLEGDGSADIARVQVTEAAELCRQLQAVLLDGAGAALALSRLYDKLAEEAE